MQRLGRPLHFLEATELVNKAGFDSKIYDSKTVQNYLIRDDRFVNIGRGIYGLEEWGHRPGTVAEIIKEIIQQRPGELLAREEIVRLVLEQRQVKASTVRIKYCPYNIMLGRLGL